LSGCANGWTVTSECPVLYRQANGSSFAGASKVGGTDRIAVHGRIAETGHIKGADQIFRQYSVGQFTQRQEGTLERVGFVPDDVEGVLVTDHLTHP
jgi:hypothetical protein